MHPIENVAVSYGSKIVDSTFENLLLWNVTITVPSEQRQVKPDQEKPVHSGWVSKYETPKKSKILWFEDKENQNP